MAKQTRHFEAPEFILGMNVCTCVCVCVHTRICTRYGRRHYRGDYPGEGGHRWWNFMPRQCETLDPSSASSVSTFLRSFATTEWTRSFKLSVILRSLARSSIISLSRIVEIMSKKASAIYKPQRCAKIRFYFTFYI